jgi:hypothetical protein
VEFRSHFPELQLDSLETVMALNLDLLSDAVERLQRDNLRLKRIGMSLLILIGAALVMGQSRPTRTIEAEAFVLKGSDGSIKAKLDTKDGIAEFLFYNRAGQPRVAITSGEEGEAIEMRDDSGELLATMAVHVQKAPKTSPTMSTIAALGSLSGPGIIMQASKEGTLLRVSDKGGHEVWAAPSKP